MSRTIRVRRHHGKGGAHELLPHAGARTTTTPGDEVSRSMRDYSKATGSQFKDQLDALRPNPGKTK